MSELNSLPQRSETDAAKGLGIIAVVAGHLSYPIFSTTHIYIYHMPLFFFLSGIALGYKRGVFATVFSDFKNIFLYTIGLTFAYALVGKVIFWEFGVKFVNFQGISLEDFTTKIFTENSHHVLLFLVGWFLVALFFARALAIFLIEGVRRLVPVRMSGPLLLLLALLLCYVGMDRLAPAFHATRNPWLNLGAQVAVAAGFILLGREALANRLVLVLLRYPLAGFVLATALYEGVVLGGVKPLSMAWSEYPAGFLRHMLGALLGILLVLTIAFTIARVRPDNLCVFRRIRPGVSVESAHRFGETAHPN